MVHQGAGLAGARYIDIALAPVAAGLVQVQLEAAALNHRDLWNCRGRGAEEPAVILGSDGAGVIEQVGAAVEQLQPGDEVVINSSTAWADGTAVPQGRYGVDYKILGHPEHGTFAEQIVIDARQVEPRPAFLSWGEAAALSLVGLTTYRALFTEGRLEAGHLVVIPGIGGGAATQALLFAKAAGARVAVTSRSPAKLAKARELGADLALISDSDWAADVREATAGRGADLVIETVGRPTWDRSLACLANGGRLVVFGATAGGAVEVDVTRLFLRWQSIIGTTMGSRQEFQEMLGFVTSHQIRPVVDRSFPLAAGVAALEYLDSGAQFGKVTLAIGAADG